MIPAITPPHAPPRAPRHRQILWPATSSLRHDQRIGRGSHGLINSSAICIEIAWCRRPVSRSLPAMPQHELSIIASRPGINRHTSITG